MANLRDDVKLYVESRAALGNWKTGTTLENLGWLATEVGEAFDAFFRMNPDWVRNNPGSAQGEQFLTELGDIIFMAYVTALGFAPDADLETIIRNKMARTRL